MIDGRITDLFTVKVGVGQVCNLQLRKPIKFFYYNQSKSIEPKLNQNCQWNFYLEF